MTDVPPDDLDAVGQDVFDLMRRHPGEVFSPQALASVLGYARPEIEAALTQLLQLGFIEPSPAAGTAAYILSPAAPEL